MKKTNQWDDHWLAFPMVRLARALCIHACELISDELVSVFVCSIQSYERLFHMNCYQLLVWVFATIAKINVMLGSAGSVSYTHNSASAECQRYFA